MANRHSHKQRRRAIRDRMAATGESYQRALQQLSRAPRCARPLPRVPELLAVTYFGVPVTIAVYEILSRARVILVSGCGGPLGLPLGAPSPLHVRPAWLQ